MNLSNEMKYNSNNNHGHCKNLSIWLVLEGLVDEPYCNMLPAD